jgi:hypothetical protein
VLHRYGRRLERIRLCVLTTILVETDSRRSNANALLSKGTRTVAPSPLTSSAAAVRSISLKERSANAIVTPDQNALTISTISHYFSTTEVSSHLSSELIEFHGSDSRRSCLRRTVVPLHRPRAPGTCLVHNCRVTSDIKQTAAAFRTIAFLLRGQTGGVAPPALPPQFRK